MVKVGRYPLPTDDQNQAMAASFKIERFSGLNCGISPANFLNMFSSYVTVQSLNSDKQKIAAFHLHLQGEAMSWFSGLSQEETDTWGHVQTAFRIRFIENNIQNEPDMISAMHAFNAMSLAPGQSISDYFIMIQEKSKSLGKSAAETTLRFVDGLPTELKFFVRTGSPKSLEEAFTAARNGEAYGYRATQTCSHVPVPAAIPTVAAISPELNEVKSNLASLTAIVKSQQEMMKLILDGKNHDQTREQRGATNARGSTQRTNDSQRAITCHNCRGQGHVQRVCNLARNARSRPDFLCYICNQYGHGSRCCAQNQGN